MERLLRILECVKEDVNYKEEKELITNGILDSIDLVALMGDLEDEFEVEITYDMLNAENFDSIDKIENLIKKLKKEA